MLVHVCFWLVCVFMCGFRAWRKLDQVLRSWLETTGSDVEASETSSVQQELKEVTLATATPKP